MRVLVSKATHDKLREFNAPFGLNDEETIYHPNGMVEFPISKAVEARLRKINPNLERAILIALGAKPQ
jgi:hypothetical protein